MAIVILDDDYSPPSQGYYLREEAWSELNGTRLLRASRSNVDTDVPEGFPTRSTPVAGAPQPPGRSLVHTTVALLVDHPRPLALEAPILLAPAQNPNPARFRRAYRVTSLAQRATFKELLGHHAGDPAWPADVRAHYLAVPDDPRYATLAHEIAAKIPARVQKDPFALAAAVKLQLDEAFSYSTKHRHAGVPDPTADFLFGDRIGYCVHFAHAAVYLWRALEIPARVGAGYHVEEDARQGGSSILVRSRDAHAWPELYLEGYGWVVLDIAPKQNLDPPAPPVDSELQRMLGEMARSLPADPEDTSGEPRRAERPPPRRPVAAPPRAPGAGRARPLRGQDLAAPRAPLRRRRGAALGGVPRGARHALRGGGAPPLRREPGGVRGAGAGPRPLVRGAHRAAPPRRAGPPGRRRPRRAARDVAGRARRRARRDQGDAAPARGSWARSTPRRSSAHDRKRTWIPSSSRASTSPTPRRRRSPT